MTTIVLDTNAASLVSANRRIHWAQRAKLQKHWRTVAYIAARNEHHAAGQVDTGLGAHRLKVTATVRYPDARRRDTANLYPLVVKPAIDGLVDAGLLPDDSDRWVESVEIRRDTDKGPHRVTLTVARAERSES